jgi:hypothetical protein
VFIREEARGRIDRHCVAPSAATDPPLVIDVRRAKRCRFGGHLPAHCAAIPKRPRPGRMISAGSHRRRSAAYEVSQHAAAALRARIERTLPRSRSEGCAKREARCTTSPPVRHAVGHAHAASTGSRVRGSYGSRCGSRVVRAERSCLLPRQRIAASHSHPGVPFGVTARSAFDASSRTTGWAVGAAAARGHRARCGHGCLSAPPQAPGPAIDRTRASDRRLRCSRKDDRVRCLYHGAVRNDCPLDERYGRMPAR